MQASIPTDIHHLPCDSVVTETHTAHAGALCPLAPFAGSGGSEGPLGSGPLCAWPCADLCCFELLPRPMCCHKSQQNSKAAGGQQGVKAGRHGWSHLALLVNRIVPVWGHGLPPTQLERGRGPTCPSGDRVPGSPQGCPRRTRPASADQPWPRLPSHRRALGADASCRLEIQDPRPAVCSEGAMVPKQGSQGPRPEEGSARCISQLGLRNKHLRPCSLNSGCVCLTVQEAGSQRLLRKGTLSLVNPFMGVPPT